MVKVLRVVGGIVAGLALAFVLVALVEMFSEAVYPAPNGMNTTHEELCAHVAAYPHWILVVAGLAWGAIAFVSTWVARRLGNLGSGIFVGLLLLAGVVCNVSMLPYYVWFKVAILVLVPVAVLL